jgi:CBS domain-containing protein
VTTVTVRDIMQADVPMVAPGDSVARVSRVLSDSNLPGVPVLENGAVIGIVTDKDIIQREATISAPAVVPFLDAFFVLDAGRDLDEELQRVLATSVRDLMTGPVINIRDSATIEETATVMLDMGVSVLPVLDDSNTLVGIVSRHDLVRVIARLESDGIV